MLTLRTNEITVPQGECFRGSLRKKFTGTRGREEKEQRSNGRNCSNPFEIETIWRSIPGSKQEKGIFWERDNRNSKVLGAGMLEQAACFGTYHTSWRQIA